MNALRSWLVVALVGVAAIMVGAAESQGGSGANSSGVATVRVKGKGMGVTKEEALKDACRDAIERAVGMYVDSEQLVDNDLLVRDKILTHSNAYIERYDEVNLVNHSGMLELQIVAWVRKQALTQRIREVMPTMTVNVTKISQNLYAQIVTEDKRDMDAEALLKAEFENFDPLAQLMKVTIVNEKPEVSQSKESGDERILSYQLKFQIDPDKYFKVWVPRMDRILSQISISPVKNFNFNRIRECDDVWRRAPMETYSKLKRTEYFTFDKMYFMRARLFEVERFVWGEECDCGWSRMIFAITDVCRDAGGSLYDLWEDWNYNGHRCGMSVRRWGVAPEMKAGRKLYVVLVKRVTRSGVSGSLYELSGGSAAVISEWMSNYSGLKEERKFEDRSGRTTVYRLMLNDSSVEEVAGGESVAFNHDMSNVGCVSWGRDDYSDERDKPGNIFNYVIYMTPFVGCFSNAASTWIDVEVPTEDIPRIASISIKPEKR